MLGRCVRIDLATPDRLVPSIILHRALVKTRSSPHYLGRYDIEIEVVTIDIDEAGDTITVRVSADLAPLFPDFGLALDHTVVREGEAQVQMRAWVP